MRKPFVEPEMKKIELNLKENIADSDRHPISSTYLTFYINSLDEGLCKVIDSKLLISQVTKDDLGALSECLDLNIASMMGNVTSVTRMM